MPLSIKLSGGGDMVMCDHCEDGLAIPIVVRTDEGEASGAVCASCLSLGREHVFFPLPIGTKKRIKPKRIRKMSKKQDAQVMGGLEDGRVQRGSGCVPGYKGDGRVLGTHRIETKYSLSDTFKLELADLTKIQGECWQEERPVVVIDFKDRQTGKLRSRWACIPHSDWERYANAQTADDRRPEDDS